MNFGIIHQIKASHDQTGGGGMAVLFLNDPSRDSMIWELELKFCHYWSFNITKTKNTTETYTHETEMI